MFGQVSVGASKLGSGYSTPPPTSGTAICIGRDRAAGLDISVPQLRELTR
jgi:hypothetical protein